MKLKYFFALSMFLFLVDNCSSEDSNFTDEQQQDDSDDDMGDPQNVNELNARFVFDTNLVIENSWNTGGCDSPPCDTQSESLNNVFNNSLPNEPYFYMEADELELNLECQPEKGRRIEFKQNSEGPLNSYSKIEFEAVYYDIPDDGFTIAQVHNRGGNSNKPFFRLELHNDKLETVIRRDPEVSSSETTFSKIDFPFLDGGNYTTFPLKIILEKSGGSVKIKVTQDNTVILERTFLPNSSTNWVTNNGIANGYYLKAGAYNAATTHTKNLVLGYRTFKFESNDN